MEEKTFAGIKSRIEEVKKSGWGEVNIQIKFNRIDTISHRVIERINPIPIETKNKDYSFNTYEIKNTE